MTERVGDAAIQAVRDMHASPGFRCKHIDLGDVLIAATAQENLGVVGVLHDDTDFDDLATVMDFDPVRFLPEGEKRPKA